MDMMSIAVAKTMVNSTVEEIKEQFGAPLVANAASGMTDQDRVYVYTGNETGFSSGHWYYYNGSNWADGGVYNAVAIETDDTLSVSGKAADGKAVGDQLTDLKSAFKQEVENVFPESRMQFFEIGTNLFNGNKVTGRIKADGTLDTTAIEYWTSDYIYVPNSGGKYALIQRVDSLFRFAVGCYDAFMNKLYAHSSGVQTAVSIPEGTVWIRFSEKTDSETRYMLAISNSSTAIAYQPYYAKLKAVPNSDMMDFISNNISEIGPGSVSFLKNIHSENLFDKTKAVTGRLANNGTVDDTATSYFTTDYIDISDVDPSYYIVPCISSTNIGKNGYGFYDANKGFISGSGGSSNTGNTIPTGAKYYRASYGIAQLSTFAVVANATGTIGTNNKRYFNRYEIDEDVVPYNWYTGKKATALGDSITANGNISGTTHSGWRNFVANEMMFADVIYNCGIGGTRVSGSGSQAMWQDVRINAIPSDTDVLFFNGGMNDWGGDAILGDEDSTDTNTFYGALNTIVQKIMARVPNALIFFMTTTLGYQNGSLKNAQNLTTYDYGRAIKKVAEKNGFPCIDLHALSGINIYNMATYINNDGTEQAPIYIHPNLQAGAKLTTAICSVLKANQPIMVVT